MRKTKKSKIFAKGQKWFFTLALFLLVFAVASSVKVWAAGNVTGWLWGGGTESDGVAPWNGTNTNVGWISVNRSDCDSDRNGVTDRGNYSDCPVGQGITTSDNYGLNIPSSNGAVTGYAWSENLGWIDFSGVSVTTTASEKRLSGRARIVGIKTEYEKTPSNSGGWLGWIKMAGDGANWSGSSCAGTNNYNNSNRCNYGVKIDGSGNFSGYAWSDELGWVDFSKAKYEESCTLEFVPSTKTIDENSSGTVTIQEVSAGANCNSGTVTLAKNNPIVSSLSPISVDFSSPAKQTATITLGVGSVASDTTFSNAVSASSTKGGSASLNLVVRNIPVCNLVCPSEIVVSPGQTVSVKSQIGITGETGCVLSAVSCSESGTDEKGNIDVTGSCDVSETKNLRYGSSTLRAVAGTGSCTSPISVKGLGWIETN